MLYQDDKHHHQSNTWSGGKTCKESYENKTQSMFEVIAEEVQLEGMRCQYKVPVQLMQRNWMQYASNILEIDEYKHYIYPQGVGFMMLSEGNIGVDADIEETPLGWWTKSCLRCVTWRGTDVAIRVPLAEWWRIVHIYNCI